MPFLSAESAANLSLDVAAFASQSAFMTLPGPPLKYFHAHLNIRR
jgi:hypothetical protein